MAEHPAIQKRENAIRGTFSFVAATALLYMSGEYTEAYIKAKSPYAVPIAVLCLGLSVLEITKVGKRVERILNLE